MKAIPQYSDFELDYKKFPRPQASGVVDMDAVKRLDYRDAMFEKAKDDWMEEAEQHNEKLSLKLRGAESLLEIRDNQIKELKEEVRELTNRYIKEVENGSRSREKLAELELSMEPTETIIRGFANLFDGYVKNQHIERQINELKKH